MALAEIVSVILYGQPSLDVLCPFYVHARRTALWDVPLQPLEPLLSKYTPCWRDGLVGPFRDQPLPAACPGVFHNHCLPVPQYSVFHPVHQPFEQRSPVERRGAPERVLPAATPWERGVAVVEGVTTTEGRLLVAG